MGQFACKLINAVLCIYISESEHGYAATRPAAVVHATNLRRKRGGKLPAQSRSVFIANSVHLFFDAVMLEE